MSEKEWVAAFDPGKVNFAFIIEEIDKDLLKNIVCPLKKDRFIKDKESKKRHDIEPSESYLLFLEEFYHCGKTILCSNTDITKQLTVNEESSLISSVKKKRRTKEEIEKDKLEKTKNKDKKRGSKALDQYVFLRMTALLDSHKEYFDKCTTIIIEQQMSFGTRVNTMAIKIAQHIYSYFLFRYGDSKTIVEFPSYNKTQILGAPGGLEKPKRKKWAIEKADEIWTLRGDMETVEMVGSKKKKDDMSDCLLHVLSYIILNSYKI
jgi:hypothetical protein